MQLLGTRLTEAEYAGITLRTAGELSLLEGRIDDAAALSADRLRDAVADLYLRLGRTLAAVARMPVRMWNYMPMPTTPLDADRDRYMAFNQGRGDGYRSWTHAGIELAHFPTASGVGIEGDALVVCCLASTEHAEAVENPRQTPAWRYSRQYGPTPPSFARATITMLAGRRRLLIGGTASVVGEDTAHLDDIAGQLDETFENLAALIATARADATPDVVIRSLRNVRVYLTRPDDASYVRDRLITTWPRLTDIELVVAPLCRRNLLVEIEGVAELTPPE
jgi:chorismate lyase/3-hydroxybenzoate synthase